MTVINNSKIRFYTFAEACKIIRTSPNTLRKALKNGEIYASKLGGRWKFTEQSLIDFGSRNEKPKVYTSHNTYIRKRNVKKNHSNSQKYSSYREHAKQIGII